MTNILALDLSTVRTGCAWGNELIGITGTRLVAWPGGRLTMADKIIDAFNLAETDVLVIEDTFLDKNPATFKVLNRLAGAIEFYAYRCGVCVLYASTAEIDAACGIPHTDRAQRKAATRRIAELLLPGRAMSEDECDAVCLLVWAQGRVKVQGWEEMSVEGA